MKTLSLDQLENINGGLRDFVDGICATAGIAALFTGVGSGLAVGCALWGAYRLFN